MENWQKDFCLRGHPFDEVNTLRLADGERRCRACHRARERHYRRLKRGNRKANQPPQVFESRYRINPDTGCWNWISSAREPRIHIKGKPMRPYQVSYIRHKGPIPAGCYVVHSCRNRACVNPAHLEAVAPAVSVQRGRSTKLSIEQVDYIRSSPETASDIRKKLGGLVSVKQIYRIRRGMQWRR